MKKVVVLSGMSGIGKTTISKKLLQHLNAEIITGDSMQIYSNYKISSNRPSDLDDFQHLRGTIDVYDQRINALDYKAIVEKKVQEIHAKDKIAIIEGGSGFYLKYLLTSEDIQFDTQEWENSLQQADQLIKENRYEWSVINQKLGEICKSYDQSIQKNDFYRLRKAIQYAIQTKGQTFKERKNPESIKLINQWDVRGFFLTQNIQIFQHNLYQRCDEMIQNGFLEEFLEFCSQNNKKVMYEVIPTPIGFKEAVNYVNNLIDISREYNFQRERALKLVQLETLEFVSEFQTKSRQYSQYQKKYFRTYFPYFKWIEKNNDLYQNVVDIIKYIEIDKNQFQQIVASDENQNIINLRDDKKITKLLKPLPLQKNQEQVITYIIQNIYPRVQK